MDQPRHTARGTGPVICTLNAVSTGKPRDVKRRSVPFTIAVAVNHRCGQFGHRRVRLIVRNGGVLLRELFLTLAAVPAEVGQSEHVPHDVRAIVAG